MRDANCYPLFRCVVTLPVDIQDGPLTQFPAELRTSRFKNTNCHSLDWFFTKAPSSVTAIRHYVLFITHTKKYSLVTHETHLSLTWKRCRLWVTEYQGPRFSKQALNVVACTERRRHRRSLCKQHWTWHSTLRAFSGWCEKLLCFKEPFNFD